MILIDRDTTLPATRTAPLHTIYDDQEAISIIMKYGHCSHVRGDTKSWSMSKQEKRYARGDLGKAFTKIEKKLGYLVIKNNTLITVAHPYKKFKKKK